MPPPPTRRFDGRWTLGNLRVLCGLCAAAAGAVALRAGSQRFELGAASPPVDARRLSAALEKVNPNAAGAASLQRLPGLGPVRARAIIDYRDAHGGEPFRRPEDLQKVRGLGPATVQRLQEHLEF